MKPRWFERKDVSGAAPDAARALSIQELSELTGLPEEKLAMMSQMMASGAVPEDQMGPMLKMASSKGIKPDQIAATMRGFGVPEDKIARVMRAEGLATSDEVDEVESAARAARRKKVVRRALIIVFWMVVWQIADMVVDNRLILAGPIRVVEALVEQLAKSDFWAVCAASTGRIAAGFLISFVAGLGLAVFAHRVRFVRELLDPVMSLLKTIPMVSIVIMLLIWVGNQALTIYLSFLIVLPLIYINMLTGLDHVDPQMLEMARVFRIGAWKRFFYIYRPAFMPFLVSSCKMSLGMSWKAGIMAEVLATPNPSIGKEMMQAKTFLDTPDLFAWTVVVIVLSLVFEKVFMELLKLAGRPWGSLLGRRGDAQQRARR